MESHSKNLYSLVTEGAKNPKKRILKTSTNVKDSLRLNVKFTCLECKDSLRSDRNLWKHYHKNTIICSNCDFKSNCKTTVKSHTCKGNKDLVKRSKDKTIMNSTNRKKIEKSGKRKDERAIRSNSV